MKAIGIFLIIVGICGTPANEGMIVVGFILLLLAD